MKNEKQIIILAFFLGIMVWIADALIDAWLFYEGSLADLLIFDVPGHELYIRVLVLTFFVVFGFITSHLFARQKKTEESLAETRDFLTQLLESIPLPIFFKDEKGIYVGCNRAFAEFLGKDKDEILGRTVSEIYPKEQADKYLKMDRELFDNPGVQFYEFTMRNNEGEDRQVIFHKASFSKASGEVAGLIGAMLDITDRVRAEEEKERLIADLRDALDQVKVLSGFLPICSSCKKIRDDKGYWSQVEVYIRDHSEAEFSHSICPDCVSKHYPDLNIKT